MGKVCVVTGGGSGMGLAAAKFMPKDRIIVVSGRTESKLTKAVSVPGRYCIVPWILRRRRS